MPYILGSYENRSSKTLENSKGEQFYHRLQKYLHCLANSMSYEFRGRFTRETIENVYVRIVVFL